MTPSERRAFHTAIDMMWRRAPAEEIDTYVSRELCSDSADAMNRLRMALAPLMGPIEQTHFTTRAELRRYLRRALLANTALQKVHRCVDLYLDGEELQVWADGEEDAVVEGIELALDSVDEHLDEMAFHRDDRPTREET